MCLALLESDAKFDASFLLHILYIRICWETWELKAACSCLKPKKNANKMLTSELFAERMSYSFIHPPSECFMILVTQRLAGRFTGSTSLLPSRADFGPFMNGPSSTVWLCISAWLSEFTWETENWEADQGCKPWSHLLHAFELLLKGCHVASALKHMFRYFLNTNMSSQENASKQQRELQDISRLCSLLSKSNHSNEVCTMSNIILNYMIMNDHLFMMLENLGSCNVQKNGCRGICLIQFHLETSLAVVTSGSLAAHPKCPALGACLAHAWDTMILSQIQKKYPVMKIENWRNLIEPGNVMNVMSIFGNIWHGIVTCLCVTSKRLYECRQNAAYSQELHCSRSSLHLDSVDSLWSFMVQRCLKMFLRCNVSCTANHKACLQSMVAPLQEA